MNNQLIQRAAQKGQGLVEYALILVLVAIVVIVIVSVAGTSIRDMFCQVGGAVGVEELPDECKTDAIAITNVSYNSSSHTAHIDATSDGGMGTDVTLLASPGGTMEAHPAHNHWHLEFSVSGCPCTVKITSTGGGTASVTVGP